MSDSDRIAMRYKAETTFGALETGNKFTNLRLVSESLGQDSTFIQSNEIVSDRQVADMIRAGVSSAGDINFEFSYGAYDDFLAAVLMDAAWNAAVSNSATTYAAVEVGNKIQDSASAFVSDGYLVGQWVQITGFTGLNSGNNSKVAKITALTAAEMTLSGITIANDGEGESVTIEQGAYIQNDALPTLTSYNLEKEFTDLSSEFEILTGNVIDTMNLSLTPEQILTGSFGFMGQDAASATATTGDGSPTAAPTNPIINAIDNVTAILETYVAYGSTNLDLTITNSLRSRLQIGTLGAVSIGQGKFVVSGNLQAYFTTKTLMDKYLANTATSLALVITDDSSNVFVIDMPQVKLTNGRRVAGGINTDIIANFDFTAYKHATELVTMRMVRFPV